MFRIGLVFSMKFTEAELGGPASWSLFDKKIMEGIRSLPGNLKLPHGCSTAQPSANDTLWTLVKCHEHAVRGQGRRAFQFNLPQPMPVTSYTLETIIDQFAVDNPISGPDDSPIPPNLLVIGAPS
jgi:hypothetical protein